MWFLRHKLILTISFIILLVLFSCGPEKAPVDDDDDGGAFSDDDASGEDDDWTVDDDQGDDDSSDDDSSDDDDDSSDDDDDNRPDVLILDDGISGEGFIEALAQFEIEGEIWGLETEYYGEELKAPVVVLFDGGPEVWGVDMPDEGQSALVDFIVNGGGLMITEWVLYDKRENAHYSILSDILPAQMGLYADFGNMTETFTLNLPSHPISDQLPPSFSMNEISISHLTAIRGDVVITGENSGDSIVADTTNQGRLVYCAFAGASDGAFGSLDLWNNEMAILARNIITWLNDG